MNRVEFQSFWQDKKIRNTLLGGLFLQLLMSVTSVGFYHPDQHFQLIEFSSWQLGRENGATGVWEYTHFVRPSLQVYLFSSYRLAMEFLGAGDPFLQMTVLRIIQGLALLVLFNYIVLTYFKYENRKIVWWVLLILNFSWFLPYTRTLYNSEIISAGVLFGSLAWYDRKKERSPGFLFLVLIGFLFSIAFFLRFQVGFAFLGAGAWFLFNRKYLVHLLPMSIGFIIGFGLNTWLDQMFYHEWVITPYAYFYVNIVEKRAASFGTSSFLMYVGWLALTLTAPFFSLVLLYYIFRSWRTQIRQLLFLSSFFFFVAHCMVGHKEERFIFTVFNILPVLAGWGLPLLYSSYQYGKSGFKRIIRISLVSTIIINTLLLIVLLTTPYSQTVYFSSILNSKFKNQPTTIYCFERTPFETPHQAQMLYYRDGVKNINIVRFNNIDSLRLIREPGSWVATTFNNIRYRRGLPDSLGFRTVTHSSGLLWNLNLILDRVGLKNTIEDIWVLYQKEPRP